MRVFLYIKNTLKVSTIFTEESFVLLRDISIDFESEILSFS